MPSGPLGPGRATLYDRNAMNRRNGYAAANVAPHGATVRSNYTVPAGSLAIVRYLHESILRVTVAAPVGPVQAFWSTGDGVTWHYTNTSDNTAGAQNRNVVGLEVGLASGEVLSLTTADAGTGGTVTYHCVSFSQELVI